MESERPFILGGEMFSIRLEDTNPLQGSCNSTTTPTEIATNCTKLTNIPIVQKKASPKLAVIDLVGTTVPNHESPILTGNESSVTFSNCVQAKKRSFV